jgi:3-deoxy-D-manno-octulosonic-acid transferase
LPLIARLRAVEENFSALLTCTSPTGLERGAAQVESTRLLPLDAPWCVRRAVRVVRPKRLVVCETELWPTLLHAVAQRKVPVHIVNGRISEYTWRWYRAAAALVRPLLGGVSSVCVPSAQQAERYRFLGVPSHRIVVTGHSKYDAAPRFAEAEVRAQLRRAFFPALPASVPIVVLGSVRPGEEKLWLEGLQHCRAAGLQLACIVAPRHQEKFPYFAEQLRLRGASCARWSQRQEWSSSQGAAVASAAGSHAVVLLDTMGELEAAYACADLAFVGATLVDVGGHNPLEPAMYGVPVVVGPHIAVIRDTIAEMRLRGGVFEVRSGADICALLERVGRGDPALAAVGQAGRSVWSAHTGAAQRIVEVLRGALGLLENGSV